MRVQRKQLEGRERDVRREISGAAEGPVYGGGSDVSSRSYHEHQPTLERIVKNVALIPGNKKPMRSVGVCA